MNVPYHVDFIVPWVNIQHWPYPNHVVAVIADVLDVLVLNGHLGQDLKEVWGPLTNCVCRVKTIYKQRPSASAFMPQTVEHLDPGTR